MFRSLCASPPKAKELGDFYLQPLWIDVPFRQSGQDTKGITVGTEFQRRRVDCHRDRRKVGHDTASIFEHDSADFLDKADFLGNGDEDVGSDETFFRMPPPGKRFHG